MARLKTLYAQQAVQVTVQIAFSTTVVLAAWLTPPAIISLV